MQLPLMATSIYTVALESFVHQKSYYVTDNLVVVENAVDLHEVRLIAAELLVVGIMSFVLFSSLCWCCYNIFMSGLSFWHEA